MALSVEVSGDSLLGWLLIVSEADDSDATVIRVTRVDRTGYYETVAVRGMDRVPITSSTMSVTDYEAPINTELRYTVDVYVAENSLVPVATITTPTIETTLPTGYAIITDALNPEERVAGGIIDLSQWTFPARAMGVHHILGRRNPVVVMDVQGGRTGDIVASNLNVWDIAFDEEGPYEKYDTVYGDWNTIFRQGRTLLFRSDHTLTGFDDLYFCVTGDVAASRISKVVGSETIPMMQYTIPYTEVDRPLTTAIGLNLATWQDVLDSNATWGDVLLKHSTWLSVLKNPTL